MVDPSSIFSIINFDNVFSEQFGITLILTLHIHLNNHSLFLVCVLISTAITIFSFHKAPLHLFHSCFHHIKTSSISTFQLSFVLLSKTIIFLNFLDHDHAVSTLIQRSFHNSSALTHSLLDTSSQHINKIFLNGILALFRIVHAVTEKLYLQFAQILTLLVFLLQYFSLEHLGHTQFHLIPSKYTILCSSVHNKSMNSIKFFGVFMSTV